MKNRQFSIKKETRQFSRNLSPNDDLADLDELEGFKDDQKNAFLSKETFSIEDSVKKVVLNKIGTPIKKEDNAKNNKMIKNFDSFAWPQGNFHTSYERSKVGGREKQKYLKAMTNFLDFKMKSVKVETLL